MYNQFNELKQLMLNKEPKLSPPQKKPRAGTTLMAMTHQMLHCDDNLAIGRCHIFLTASRWFFFVDAFNSLVLLQLTRIPADNGHFVSISHFGLTASLQSHGAHTSFFRLDCANAVDSSPGRLFVMLFYIFEIFSAHFSMYLFSMFFARCVGQAKNPGPETQTLKPVIANPTALHKKVSRLLKMDADVFVTSETSATDIIQKEIFPMT